jgi:hypothetical protein
VPDGYEVDNTDCQDDDPLDGSCTIENKLVRIARFAVNKEFTDNNPAEVQVTITCNDGFVSQDGTADISQGAGHDFVVTDYSGAGTMDCWVKESIGQAGYDPTYEAGATTGQAGRISDTEPEPGCYYEDIVGGNFFCDLENTPKDGEFSLTKSWDSIGDATDLVEEVTSLIITCDRPVSGGSPAKSNIDSSDGKYFGSYGGTTNNGAFTGYELYWEGDGTVTVDVELIDGPAKCTGSESGADLQLVEQSLNTCTPDQSVTAGGRNGCAITNTVFFEGIPTLSQYGLAIMALLMLGVGLVGFRRLA